jgi:hypothetical protein
VVITGSSGGYPDLHGVYSPGSPLVRPTKWWAHRGMDAARGRARALWVLVVRRIAPQVAHIVLDAQQ